MKGRPRKFKLYNERQQLQIFFDVMLKVMKEHPEVMHRGVANKKTFEERLIEYGRLQHMSKEDVEEMKNMNIGQIIDFFGTGFNGVNPFSFSEDNPIKRI